MGLAVACPKDPNSSSSASGVGEAGPSSKVAASMPNSPAIDAAAAPSMVQELNPWEDSEIEACHHYDEDIEAEFNSIEHYTIGFRSHSNRLPKPPLKVTQILRLLLRRLLE